MNNPLATLTRTAAAQLPPCAVNTDDDGHPSWMRVWAGRTVATGLGLALWAAGADALKLNHNTAKELSITLIGFSLVGKVGQKGLERIKPSR